LAYKRQDVFHVLPFVLYFGIWLTPVFFTDSFIPEKFRSFLLFNPMANVVDIWRWVIFGYGEFSVWWLLNFSVSFCLMLAGLYLFVGREDEFSDYV
jgi:lipopolysaccharide transport system permease protein